MTLRASLVVAAAALAAPALAHSGNEKRHAKVIQHRRAAHHHKHSHHARTSVVDTAINAVELMSEGVAKFVAQKSLGAEADAQASRKLLADIGDNFKSLKSVLSTTREKQLREKESAKTELAQLRAENAQLQATAGNCGKKEVPALQKSVEKLLSQNAALADELDKSQKSCAPSTLSLAKQADLVSADKGLKDENAELKEHLLELQKIGVETLAKNKEIVQNDQTLMNELVSLKTDKQSLLKTVQNLLHNDLMAKLERAKKNMANEKAEMTEGFVKKERDMNAKVATCEASKNDLQETAREMQTRFLDLGKQFEQCRADAAGAKKQQKALQEERDSVMQSMQAVLRQNAKYEQLVVKDRKEKREAREAKQSDDVVLNNIAKKSRDSGDGVLYKNIIANASKQKQQARQLAKEGAKPLVKKGAKWQPSQVQRRDLERVMVPVSELNKPDTSGFDIRVMGSTADIDTYTAKAEAAIEQLPSQNSALSKWAGYSDGRAAPQQAQAAATSVPNGAAIARKTKAEEEKLERATEAATASHKFMELKEERETEEAARKINEAAAAEEKAEGVVPTPAAAADVSEDAASKLLAEAEKEVSYQEE